VEIITAFLDLLLLLLLFITNHVVQMQSRVIRVLKFSLFFDFIVDFLRTVVQTNIDYYLDSFRFRLLQLDILNTIRSR